MKKYSYNSIKNLSTLAGLRADVAMSRLVDLPRVTVRGTQFDPIFYRRR